MDVWLDNFKVYCCLSNTHTHTKNPYPINRNCNSNICDHLLTQYGLWCGWWYWGWTYRVLVMSLINNKQTDFSFKFTINERQHIALVVFLHDTLQESYSTWEAICVCIDYFSPRDNECQLWAPWRSSCFPEINILLGSLSPSSKILIRATVSCSLLPAPNLLAAICHHSPGISVYLCTCTYANVGGPPSWVLPVSLFNSTATALLQAFQ